MRKILFLLFVSLFLNLGSCEEKAETIPVLVQNSGISDIEAFGSVEIEHELELSVALPAKISSIDVKEGQSVEAGQILAVLDFSLLEKERSNILSEMEPLKKEITRLKEQLLEMETILKQQSHPELLKYQFMIQVQESRKTALLKEYDHKKILTESGISPAQTLKELDEEISKTNTEIQSLVYSVDSFNYQLREETRKITETLIKKETEYSFLQNERVKLTNSLKQPYLLENKLICPIQNGIVGKIYGMEGTTLSPSQPVFILQDFSTMTVIADVNEQFIDRVQLGNSATVIPDANRDYEFPGEVSFIASRAIRVNGETIIPIQITLYQENTFLKPGYNVQVFIEPIDDKKTKD